VNILRLEKADGARGIIVRSRVDELEFEQLRGQLDHLGVFAPKLVDTKATLIKTGARHSYAKYLLFPVHLRRLYKTTDYDFASLTCGAIHNQETLYIIYRVPRTTFPTTPSNTLEPWVAKSQLGTASTKDAMSGTLSGHS
jgi:hypothetical protein